MKLFVLMLGMMMMYAQSVEALKLRFKGADALPIEGSVTSDTNPMLLTINGQSFAPNNADRQRNYNLPEVPELARFNLSSDSASISIFCFNDQPSNTWRLFMSADEIVSLNSDPFSLNQIKAMVVYAGVFDNTPTGVFFGGTKGQLDQSHTNLDISEAFTNSKQLPLFTPLSTSAQLLYTSNDYDSNHTPLLITDGTIIQVQLALDPSLNQKAGTYLGKLRFTLTN